MWDILQVFKLGSKQREWASISFTFEYNNTSLVMGETFKIPSGWLKLYTKIARIPCIP